MKQVEVVAGVITDARGRVLLSRRTEGRDLAGLVTVEGLHHLERAAAHRVEGLVRRHDLAG